MLRRFALSPTVSQILKWTQTALCTSSILLDFPSPQERLKAEALKQHLRRQMTDYQAPDIAEYMHVKDRHKKLQQSIHTWERKVGIAQVNPDFIFSPPI